MIFVTVGSQAPFDRLIRALDEWAGSRARDDVFAQTAAGSYRPKHMTCEDFTESAEFKRRVKGSQLVVSHAGMGTIIAALELGKPIVVMPRWGALGETRNDHQVAAAEHFGSSGRIIVAKNENALAQVMDYAITQKDRPPISKHASPRLAAVLRAFVKTERLPVGDLLSSSETEIATNYRQA